MMFIVPGLFFRTMRKIIIDIVNNTPVQNILDTIESFEINRSEKIRKSIKVIKSSTLSTIIVAKEALFDIFSVCPMAKALTNSPPLAGRAEFAIKPTDKEPKVLPKRAFFSGFNKSLHLHARGIKVKPFKKAAAIING